MRCFLFLLICCMLNGCSTLMPCEKFFCTVSTKDIPDVSISNISFITGYIHDDCKKCGTISDPLFDFNIKYDTLSHYRVLVLGYVVFGNEMNHKNQYETIDSVGIKRLVIMRMHSQQELYGKKEDCNWSNRNWNECPLPKRILKEIRDDFLKRMKYRRYIYNKSVLDDSLSINGYTTQYYYSLY